MYERKIAIKKRNGLDIAFYVIGGKWKRDIIICLNQGINRPVDLEKHLVDTRVNSRVLRQQLKELEEFGVIYKKVHPSVPPKVEYFLTDIGIELIPLFSEMNEWGAKYTSVNGKFLQRD